MSGIEDQDEKDQYYHVQIHFKRPIKRSHGSIKFDLSWKKLNNVVLSNYRKCHEFDLEERTIHPLNVARISVCKTVKRSADIINYPGKKSEMYNLLELNAKEEEKYEYDPRQEHKEPNKHNDNNIFIKRNAFEKPKCSNADEKIKSGWIERLKRYIWLIAPFGAATGAYFAAIYLFKAEHGEPFIAAITVALGLQYFKENLPTY